MAVTETMSRNTVAFTGIKAIKLHAWEEAFLERMRRAREPELEQARCGALRSVCTSALTKACVCP